MVEIALKAGEVSRPLFPLCSLDPECVREGDGVSKRVLDGPFFCTVICHNADSSERSHTDLISHQHVCAETLTGRSTGFKTSCLEKEGSSLSLLHGKSALKLTIKLNISLSQVYSGCTESMLVFSLLVI